MHVLHVTVKTKWSKGCDAGASKDESAMQKKVFL